MIIKKYINLGILLGYNTKFSGPANKEMSGHQLGELAFRSWELKGLKKFGQFMSCCATEIYQSLFQQ